MLYFIENIFSTVTLQDACGDDPCKRIYFLSSIFRVNSLKYFASLDVLGGSKRWQISWTKPRFIVHFYKAFSADCIFDEICLKHLLMRGQNKSVNGTLNWYVINNSTEWISRSRDRVSLLLHALLYRDRYIIVHEGSNKPCQRYT